MPTKTKARKAKRSKPLPRCTKKDLRQPKSKRRSCTVAPPSKVSPTGALGAPPVTSAAPGAFPTPPPARVADAIVATAAPSSAPTGELLPAPTVAAPAPAGQPPEQRASNPTSETEQAGVTAEASDTYQGPFGQEQAFRLLYRAGFGPRPGELAAFAAKGVVGAVDSLLKPSSTALTGSAPSGSYLSNGALAPREKWGHLHLQCLDRMVRTNDPLTERMALILHDWFGISVATAQLPLVADHIQQLRQNWRLPFRQQLLDVTSSPAMLVFLDGNTSTKWVPNENYAREFLELFALGADRGAYTETDVRELTRAFTGFRCDWVSNVASNFRFDPARRDSGSKRLFAGTAHERSGDLSWTDAVNAVVNHPSHATFVAVKLWSYFIPTAPSAATVARLAALYRANGERLEPLIRAILLHPDLYLGPTMVKPPVVYTAGLLRSRAASITTDQWAWFCSRAGQLIGYPPHVSGWDDRAWLNTATQAGRWTCSTQVQLPNLVLPTHYSLTATETPDQALGAALAFWSNPPLSTGHLALLRKVAALPLIKGAPGYSYGTPGHFFACRQNILRQLVAAAPDFQVA